MHLSKEAGPLGWGGQRLVGSQDMSKAYSLSYGTDRGLLGSLEQGHRPDRSGGSGVGGHLSHGELRRDFLLQLYTA